MTVGPLRRIDLVVARLLVELCERRPSTATSVSVSFRALSVAAVNATGQAEALGISLCDRRLGSYGLSYFEALEFGMLHIEWPRRIVAGALGGAGVNYAFIDHFQEVARAHFTVRRLERRYGKDTVRAAYERISGATPAAA